MYRLVYWHDFIVYRPQPTQLLFDVPVWLAFTRVASQRPVLHHAHRRLEWRYQGFSFVPSVLLFVKHA
jgi:hypothetical protein